MSTRRGRGCGGFIIPFLVGAFIATGFVAPVFFAFGAANESQACNFLLENFPGVVASSKRSDLGDAIDRINASYMGGKKEVRYVGNFWYPNAMGSQMIEISARDGSVEVSEPEFFPGRNERGGFVEVLDSLGNTVLYYWIPPKTVRKLVDPDEIELGHSNILDSRDLEYALREKGTTLYWIDLAVAEEFLGSSVYIPSNLELPPLPGGSREMFQIPGVVRNWISELGED